MRPHLPFTPGPTLIAKPLRPEPGELDRVRKALSEILRYARREADRPMQLWAHLRLAELCIEGGQGECAEKAFSKALEKASSALERGWAWRLRGFAEERGGALQVAQEAHGRSAEAFAEAWGEHSLHGAAASIEVGQNARHRGELAVAEAAVLQALELRRAQSPSSAEVPWTVNALGLVAQDLFQFDRAEELFIEAADAFPRAHFGLAVVFNNLRQAGGATGQIG